MGLSIPLEYHCKSCIRNIWIGMTNDLLKKGGLLGVKRCQLRQTKRGEIRRAQAGKLNPQAFWTNQIKFCFYVFVTLF